MKLRYSLVCALASVALSAPALSDVTAKDLQVMGRAIAFSDKAPSGAVTVAIVYAPGNKQSADEADGLQKLMGGGFSAGSLTLKPVMVKIDDVGGSNADVFLLTSGLGGDGAKAGAVTKAKKKICVTVDIAQARSGACMMSVRSDPKVEIVVNKAAAAASGVGFAAAFRMMITEI